MNFFDVGELCQRLTIYQLKHIWANWIGGEYGAKGLSDGEALLFWTTDYLSGTGLLDQDRLQLWRETFGRHVIKIGEMGWIRKRGAKPVKVGFLDRVLAVMDGSDVFLNLEEGSTTKALPELMPLETISYDLCAIWHSYYNRLASSQRPAMVALPPGSSNAEERKAGNSSVAAIGVAGKTPQ